MVGRDGGKRGLDRFSFLIPLSGLYVHLRSDICAPFRVCCYSVRFNVTVNALHNSQHSLVPYGCVHLYLFQQRRHCYNITQSLMFQIDMMTVSTTRHCDVLHVQHQMCSLQSSYSQSSTSQQSVTSLSSHRLALLSATTSTSLSRPGRDALKGAHPPDMARTGHSLLEQRISSSQELFMRIKLVGWLPPLLLRKL